LKRLMYVIPLSAMAVLVFAAIAVAQSPSQNPATGHTTDVQNSTTWPAKKKPAEPTTPTETAEPTTPAETTTPTETTTPATTTTPAKRTAPATDTTVAVDINDLAFDPRQLDIAPGTRVMFVNNGAEAHTATADNELFDTGALERGESTWVFFRGSGTITYHDELHPDMKGSIVVGEGRAGEPTTPQKQAAEATPNEPSSDAAQPVTEAAQPSRGY
jgi:plastocyanin